MGWFETIATLLITHSIVAGISYKAGRDSQRAAGGQDE